MYIVFSIFFAFAYISGSIAQHLKNETGDPEFGRGFLFALPSGVAIVAGTVASFLILGWKALGSIMVGVVVAMILSKFLPSKLFVVRRISDITIIAICAYIYALYFGYLSPGPWESYFVS